MAAGMLKFQQIKRSFYCIVIVQIVFLQIKANSFCHNFFIERFLPGKNENYYELLRKGTKLVRHKHAKNKHWKKHWRYNHTGRCQLKQKQQLECSSYAAFYNNSKAPVFCRGTDRTNSTRRWIFKCPSQKLHMPLRWSAIDCKAGSSKNGQLYCTIEICTVFLTRNGTLKLSVSLKCSFGTNCPDIKEFSFSHDSKPQCLYYYYAQVFEQKLKWTSIRI